MSKKLNTAGIVNELHQSKFFAHKKQDPPEKSNSTNDTQAQNDLGQAVLDGLHQSKTQENDVSVVPERVERPEPSELKQRDDGSRELHRYSHDLYVDQMETLSTKVRAHFLSKGVEKSKAQMIREAIDLYISKHI